MLNSIGTIVSTVAVGFAMLGLDEISHLLEQPFKLMPLYHVSKNSMTDVGDVIYLRPPPLSEDEVQAEQDEEELKTQPPPYW